MNNTRTISEKTYKTWTLVAWGHKEPGMSNGRPVVRCPKGKFWCAVDQAYAGSRKYLMQEAVSYKAAK